MARLAEQRWPRVLFFLLLGTFSTTLVAVPAATSWMLISLVLMGVITSFFSEQRLFCRYLCPINSYISLYSTTGRVMVRPVAAKPCDVRSGLPHWQRQRMGMPLRTLRR
jgi:polyferredoxin